MNITKKYINYTINVKYYLYLLQLAINSSNNYFEVVAAFKEFQYFQQLSEYMIGHVDKTA